MMPPEARASRARPNGRKTVESAHHTRHPVRLALCGYGRWGRHILRDLLALGCEVVVADPSGAARAAAVRVGAAGAERAVSLLPAVDAAIVATPTRTHHSVIEALLPRGIPIFCEKPLTADAASAARLATAAPQRLFVMDKWRYHPGVEQLRAIARSGELGPVIGLRTVRRGTAGSQDIDAIWVIAPQDLCIALEVLGSVPEPRCAEAWSTDGTIHEFRATLGSEPHMEIDISINDRPAHRCVELRCRDGIARLSDTYDEHIEVVRVSSGEERKAERCPISTQQPLEREIGACLAYLGGGQPPRSSAAEGARIVDVIARLRALAGLDRNVW